MKKISQKKILNLVLAIGILTSVANLSLNQISAQVEPTPTSEPSPTTEPEPTIGPIPTTEPSPTEHPGGGNCYSGSNPVIKDEDAPFAVTVADDKIILAVWVKAGSQNNHEACFEYTEDTNDGCYAVDFSEDMKSVSVTKVGNGPNCKDISHIEVVDPDAEEPSPTPEVTPEPSPGPTDEPKNDDNNDDDSNNDDDKGGVSTKEEKGESKEEKKGEIKGVPTLANTGDFLQTLVAFLSSTGMALMVRGFIKKK